MRQSSRKSRQDFMVDMVATLFGAYLILWILNADLSSYEVTYQTTSPVVVKVGLYENKLNSYASLSRATIPGGSLSAEVLDALQIDPVKFNPRKVGDRNSWKKSLVADCLEQNSIRTWKKIDFQISVILIDGSEVRLIPSDIIFDTSPNIKNPCFNSGITTSCGFVSMIFEGSVESSSMIKSLKLIIPNEAPHFAVGYWCDGNQELVYRETDTETLSPRLVDLSIEASVFLDAELIGTVYDKRSPDPVNEIYIVPIEKNS